MIEILENIFFIIRPILPYSLVVALIGVFVALFSNVLHSLKVESKKFRLVGLILFSQVFIIGGCLAIIQEIIIIKIRDEFKEITHNSDTKIFQKDKVFGEFTSAELKTELLKIDNYPAHHSGTEKEMQLEILTNGISYTVTLAQDEYEKNEFWIFFDKYSFGSEDGEIGRIHTNKFK